jgi:NADP-dependent 3-hydroxy acid dehydrogenase YdfG
VKLKCALITGASSGIGMATAEVFAEEGLNLVLVARREPRLLKLKDKLEGKFKIKVSVVAADLRSAQGIAAIASAPNFASVDLLVNNAGLARGTAKLQDADPAEWDEMLETNVTGLLRLTRAVLPHMIKNNRGHVVNLGSVAGRWVYPGGAVYCASKFAVRAISEGLRLDLMGTPLRVTNIEPGMVETEFSEVRFQNKERAKGVYNGMTPLSGRGIAECILWSVQRPAHVNIQEMVVFPTDQAAIQHVHRKT